MNHPSPPHPTRQLYPVLPNPNEIAKTKSPAATTPPNKQTRRNPSEKATPRISFYSEPKIRGEKHRKMPTRNHVSFLR